MIAAFILGCSIGTDGSFFENSLSEKQALVQQKLLDPHILNAVVVSPRLQESLDDDHLLEEIRDAQQRGDLLLYFCRIGDAEYGLDIITVIPAVDHEIHFQLFSDFLSRFILAISTMPAIANFPLQLRPPVSLRLFDVQI